jgi:hypothetical protein
MRCVVHTTLDKSHGIMEFIFEVVAIGDLLVVVRRVADHCRVQQWSEDERV